MKNMLLIIMIAATTAGCSDKDEQADKRRMPLPVATFQEDPAGPVEDRNVYDSGKTRPRARIHGVTGNYRRDLDIPDEDETGEMGTLIGSAARDGVIADSRPASDSKATRASFSALPGQVITSST
jgi:hypothetical protein